MLEKCLYRRETRVAGKDQQEKEQMEPSLAQNMSKERMFRHLGQGATLRMGEKPPLTKRPIKDINGQLNYEVPSRERKLKKAQQGGRGLRRERFKIL